MVKTKKVMNCISWLVIAIISIMLFMNWNDIPSTVVTHSGGGNISYGDKSNLIIFLSIGIVVNIMYTLNIDIPFIKSLKKTKQSNTFTSIIAIIIQIMVIFVLSAFVLLPIIK